MSTPEELLDVHALAELLGIKPESVRTRKWRQGLPEPDFTVGRSPTWRRSTVEKWQAAQRKPAKP